MKPQKKLNVSSFINLDKKKEKLPLDLDLAGKIHQVCYYS